MKPEIPTNFCAISQIMAAGISKMKEKCRLTVRSVSSETRQKLTALKQSTRLPMGALLDDAISELWAMYLKDNHELPDLHYIDEMEEAQWRC